MIQHDIETNASPSNLLTPLIRSETVKRTFGGISDMTLWRWIQYRQFPKPQKIAGRSYWKAEQVMAWAEDNAD